MCVPQMRNLRHFMVLAAICSLLAAGCEREPRVSAATDASTIEQRYGLSGAYSERITDDEEAMDATVVPVTLSDGRVAQLVIPKKSSSGQRVYLREGGELHPVALQNPRVKREEFVRSEPRIVERRVVDQPRSAVATKKKRSLKKELLIVGGSSGAGAAIGAVAGGKKGAAVGALSGGVAGLIYDLATRNK
jgi:hypothetical protein